MLRKLTIWVMMVVCMMRKSVCLCVYVYVSMCVSKTDVREESQVDSLNVVEWQLQSGPCHLNFPELW